MVGVALNAKGQHMRQCLAENGIELTPDQLTKALLAAEIRLKLAHPTGLCTTDEWVEVVTDEVCALAMPEAAHG